ncbi:MAG: type II toxin-antitoxin system prevent-host-death family antitoxin [Caulobacteraceae bacterium]
MITVGIFEAKTRLSSLVERAQAGEEVQITRHGRPVARLVADSDVAAAKARAAFVHLIALRSKTSLGDLSWKALRDEGRR